MIDPKEHGIELGDRVRITIEGVVEVEELGLASGPDLALGGFSLRALPAMFRLAPTVEILEKAEPKWWSARVIRASTRFAREILVRRAGPHEGLPWQGTDGATGSRWFDHEDLRDVEVIVQ